MNNADQPTEEVVGNREDTRNCNRAAETNRTGVSAASRYKKKSKRKRRKRLKTFPLKISLKRLMVTLHQHIFL